MNSTNDNYQHFNCKICLDVAKDPVITPCGHLYCWSCLYKWSQTKGNPTKCPYCSNQIDVNKCTTIFAGESSAQDQIPKRPQNPRTEPPPNVNNNGGLFQNMNFSFGIGFPFMMGFTNINLGGGGGVQNRPDQQNGINQQNGVNQQNGLWPIGLIIGFFLFQIILPMLINQQTHTYSSLNHQGQSSFQLEDIILVIAIIGIIFGVRYVTKIYQRVRQ